VTIGKFAQSYDVDVWTANGMANKVRATITSKFYETAGIKWTGTSAAPHQMVNSNS